MRSFNLGALGGWQEIATGQVLEIDCPKNGVRSVQFEVIADSYVSVHVAYEDTAYLVGAGDGQLSIRFAVDRRAGMTIHGEPDAVVFMRTHVHTQVIPPSVDETYTTIEPARPGPSAEMRRMMEMVKLNNLRRDAELAEQRKQLQAQYDAQMQAIKAAASPPPAPPAAPPQESEAKE